MLDCVPPNSSVTIIDIEPSFIQEGLARVVTEDAYQALGKVEQLEHIGTLHPRGIKADWYSCDSRVVLRRRRTFTHIITSPCVSPSTRLLTADLRWVCAGDLLVGDRLFAFDEYGAGVTGRGFSARRRYQWAEVTFAQPARKRCVRVVLANGDDVVVTEDHPWLAHLTPGYTSPLWLRSDGLRPGASEVLLQVRPWQENHSWDAGWLAGMFDGEGSLSFGQHGSPKLQLCQVEGPVNDAVERRLRELGHSVNVIPRADIPGRKPVINTYVNGGVPGMLTALGSLRPERLLRKFMEGDAAQATLQPQRVRVVAVEPVGMRDIAGIETSSGTFIAEGYLQHNTYGNRFKDAFNPTPGRKCRGYAQSVGGPLQEGNTGAYGLASDQYTTINYEVMRAAVNRLIPGGTVIVNVSDFYKTFTKGAEPERQQVVAWWIDLLHDIGLHMYSATPVVTRRFKEGENRHRAEYEIVLVFRKENTDVRTHTR